VLCTKGGVRCAKGGVTTMCMVRCGKVNIPEEIRCRVLCFEKQDDRDTHFFLPN
jgi:hypothetical protein